MQHHPGQRDRRAEAHPDGQDAHVLDAGVGQQPFQIPLIQQIQGGEEQRRDAEGQQHVPREAGAQGRAGDLEVAQDRVEAHGEQGSGQKRGDRRRRLRMRVGQPGVHREQADLGAETQHRQHEGEPDGCVREPASDLQDRAQGEVIVLAEDLGTGEVGKDRGQQRETEPGGGDQYVLPGGLHSRLAVLDRHQQRRDHGRHFDGDPQQGQAVHHRRDQHGPAEHVEQRVEPGRIAAHAGGVFALGFLPDVADRIHRHRRVQESCGQHEDAADRVHPEIGDIAEGVVSDRRYQREHQAKTCDARDHGDRGRQPRRGRQRRDRRRERDDGQG